METQRMRESIHSIPFIHPHPLSFYANKFCARANLKQWRSMDTPHGSERNPSKKLSHWSKCYHHHGGSGMTTSPLMLGCVQWVKLCFVALWSLELPFVYIVKLLQINIVLSDFRFSSTVVDSTVVQFRYFLATLCIPYTTLWYRVTPRRNHFLVMTPSGTSPKKS